MSRFFTPGFRRFLRYASVGFGTFCFDLLLLAFFVEVTHLSIYAATPLCFMIAVSINYILSRLHVFKRTERTWGRGYLYFIGSAAFGATLSTSGVAFFVLTFGVHYLVARIGVATVVGMLNYLINLHLNFKVAGQHAPASEGISPEEHRGTRVS